MHSSFLKHIIFITGWRQSQSEGLSAIFNKNLFSPNEDILFSCLYNYLKMYACVYLYSNHSRFYILIAENV